MRLVRAKIRILSLLMCAVQAGQGGLPPGAGARMCLAPRMEIAGDRVMHVFHAQTAGRVSPNPLVRDAVLPRSAKRKWLAQLIQREGNEQFLMLLDRARAAGALDDTEYAIVSFAAGHRDLRPHAFDAAAAAVLGMKEFEVNRSLMGRQERDHAKEGFYERLWRQFRRKKQTREAEIFKEKTRQSFDKILRKNVMKFLHATKRSPVLRRVRAQVLSHWPVRTQHQRKRKDLARYWGEHPGVSITQMARDLGMSRSNMKSRIQRVNTELIEVAERACVLTPLLRIIGIHHNAARFKYLAGTFTDQEYTYITEQIQSMSDESLALKGLPRARVEEMIRLRLRENLSYLRLATMFGLRESSVTRFFDGRSPGLERRVPGSIEKFRRFLEEYFSEALNGELLPAEDVKPVLQRMEEIESRFGLSLAPVRQNVYAEMVARFIRHQGVLPEDISFSLDQGNGLRLEVTGRDLARIDQESPQGVKKFLLARLFRDDMPEAAAILFPSSEARHTLLVLRRKQANIVSPLLEEIIRIVPVSFARTALVVNERELRRHVVEYGEYYAGVHLFAVNLAGFHNTLYAFEKTMHDLSPNGRARLPRNPIRLQVILQESGRGVIRLGGAEKLTNYFLREHEIDIIQLFEQECNGGGNRFFAFTRVYERLYRRDSSGGLLCPHYLESALWYAGYEVKFYGSLLRIVRHWQEHGFDVWQRYNQAAAANGADEKKLIAILEQDLTQTLGEAVLPRGNFNRPAADYIRFILSAAGLRDHQLGERILGSEAEEKYVFDSHQKNDRQDGVEVLPFFIDIRHFSRGLGAQERKMLDLVLQGYGWDEIAGATDHKKAVFESLVSQARRYVGRGAAIDQSL